MIRKRKGGGESSKQLYERQRKKERWNYYQNSGSRAAYSKVINQRDNATKN